MKPCFTEVLFDLLLQYSYMNYMDSVNSNSEMAVTCTGL